MDRDSDYVTYTDNHFWVQRSTDLLGRGAFGKVHKGRNRHTGEFVAVKTSSRPGDYQLSREIELLRHIDSPYIVRFIDAEMIANKPGHKALIMELADSNVRDELKKLENMFGIPYRMLIRLIGHLVRGLSYLNSKKIAHRDVKPENILVFNGPNGMKFKLCDFGGSRIITDNYQPLHSICGTPGYLNEYLTANLARRTQALSYTKDECDLWSVGCTLFECATGVLPFIPANGLADTAGMHNMMVSRPSDAICGHVDENGEFIWGKDFPAGRCLYPKTFRQVLCEFIRRLFDRREKTRLTFETFAAMCEELVNLKQIRVFKANIVLCEDYFDRSSVNHFERSYFDKYAESDMPAHDLFCLLTLPAGLAVAFKGPPVTSVLSTLMEHCSEMVIMALKNESYIMPVATPEPAVHSSFAMCNHRPSLHEMKLAAANTLNVERQISELQDFVPGLIRFLRTFWRKLENDWNTLSYECKFAKRLADSIHVQAKAIGMSKETTEERKAVENNAHLVLRELSAIAETVTMLHNKSGQIDEAFASVESKPIIKEPSLKSELETVMKQRTCSPSSGAGECTMLMETDRNYLLTSFEKTMKSYHEKSSMLRKVYLEPLEVLLKNIFDLSRGLNRTRKQLEESLQLIGITEHTNKCRLETVQSESLNYMSSASNAELATLLKETEERAKQQKIRAANSLETTKELLRFLDA